MSRSHSQRFAHQELPRLVFSDPLAFARAVGDAGQATQFLAAAWDHAGAQVSPAERIAPTGLSATVERRSLSIIIHITLPPPRDAGDPVSVVVVGRGDGVTKLATTAYYVLELGRDPATRGPRFSIVWRTHADERGAIRCEGPPPDPSWLCDHVWELYGGRTPPLRHGTPTLPTWYWWNVFGGAEAMRAFADAGDDLTAQAEAARQHPILLLEEIADCAEVYTPGPHLRRLRDLRPYFRKDAAMWKAAAMLLATTTIGSPPANLARALPLITEGRTSGALPRSAAYELEAIVRSKLAASGIAAHDNYQLAEHLHASAREAEAAESAPRVARGSAPPPIHAADLTWAPLFLDQTELVQFTRTEYDEGSIAREPAFLAHGGMRAGHATWTGHESWPMARIIDARWVFATPNAASSWLHHVGATLGEGLPALGAPAQLADKVLLFGGELPYAGGDGRCANILVVRVGRVVGMLHVTQGTSAARAGQVLHPALLMPLAHRMVLRARWGVASYWLAVASASKAIAALVHSPGHDVARLLPEFPILAHPELPAAMTMLGETHAPAARALASLQAQVRAHRWSTYGATMRALVRTLLDADDGDPRVNAAHAFEIVTELRHLDPDPIWLSLDVECRVRSSQHCSDGVVQFVTR